MSREGFTNAIIGGAETLIRSAIKSVNFVLGVSGWRITRAGSAEFNDATIRGRLIAGGGVVELDGDGVSVQSIGGDAIYLVNRTGGFVAARIPDDGSKAQITSAGYFLTPEDPSPLGTAVDFAEWNVGYDNPGAANEQPWARFNGVEYTGKAAPTIMLFAQAANDANPDSTSRMELDANDIHLFVLSPNPSYQRGEYGSFLLSFTAVASATVVVTYAKTYTTAPLPYINIDSGAGVTARWVTRAIARSTTGFTAFLFSADAIVNTWTNIPVSWDTTEQH